MEGLIWRIVSNEVQSFPAYLYNCISTNGTWVSVSWQPWQLNCCQSPEYKLVSWYIYYPEYQWAWIFYINILWYLLQIQVIFFYKTSNHFCHFFHWTIFFLYILDNDSALYTFQIFFPRLGLVFKLYLCIFYCIGVLYFCVVKCSHIFFFMGYGLWVLFDNFSYLMFMQRYSSFSSNFWLSNLGL